MVNARLAVFTLSPWNNSWLLITIIPNETFSLCILLGAYDPLKLGGGPTVYVVKVLS